MNLDLEAIIQRCSSVLGISSEEFESLESFEQLPQWDSLAKIQLIVILEEALETELTTQQVMELSPKMMISHLREAKP